MESQRGIEAKFIHPDPKEAGFVLGWTKVMD